MGRAIAVQRSSIFTLEDGTWVVQRGVDRVQELLNGSDRSFSSMDISYEITDPELDILHAQGVVEQYDEFFVWLTSDLVDSSLSASLLSSTTFYFVQTNLDSSHLAVVRDKLLASGLTDRYEVAARFGAVVIMGLYEEPFSRLSHAEDAQTLLAPILQDMTLELDLRIELIRFDPTTHLPSWPSEPQPVQKPSLIRRLDPEIKPRTVVCIDSDQETHRLAELICDELGAEIASAYSGRDGMTLVQDADPALIIMELALPDLHGYEIVAYIRNNPELAHLPIIIVSALDSETDRVFGLAVANVYDYVVKPIKASEVRRRVWRALNQFTSI